MKRPGRLSSARDSWLKTYNGKNIVKGYRKHFGVDSLCAVKELEMLGISTDAGYKQQLLQTSRNVARKRAKAKPNDDYYSLLEQDDYFAYIAGYTEGGFAFGITWEEWEKLQLEETMNSPPIACDDLEDDELVGDLSFEATLEKAISDGLDDLDEIPF